MLIKMFGLSSVNKLVGFTDRLATGGTGGNPKLSSWKVNLSQYKGKTNVWQTCSDNSLHLNTEQFGKRLASVLLRAMSAGN